MPDDPLLVSIAIDRAALAIAGAVFDQTVVETLADLTDAELGKLYSIVHTVRRELAKPV